MEERVIDIRRDAAEDGVMQASRTDGFKEKRIISCGRQNNGPSETSAHVLTFRTRDCVTSHGKGDLVDLIIKGFDMGRLS